MLSVAAADSTLDPFSQSDQLDLFSGLSLSGPGQDQPASNAEQQQQNGKLRTATSLHPDGDTGLTHGHNSGLDLLGLEPDAEPSLSPISNGGKLQDHHNSFNYARLSALASLQHLQYIVFD